MNATFLVFIFCLLLTYWAAWQGRKKANDALNLSQQKLNRWQIGLSAAATGNSGFIVTGAVGLGYLYGIHWILLPLSWLLGDLLYWKLFPSRINALAKKSGATTIAQLLTHDLHGASAKYLVLFVAVLFSLLLGTYVSAQWLAGKKLLSAAFELSDWLALIIFSISIILYTAIGGFRGSVYADITQAIIRMIGTVLALLMVVYIILEDLSYFQHNISAAGDGFLEFFADLSFVSAFGFTAGWAAAAIGFGLGQPQVVSRYMAGENPEETRAAWWIYMGFLQFTWIAMTLFGVLLRGVMPELPDPEAGLSVFIAAHAGAIITGIILADIYATIASASNSILISLSQIIRHDLIEKFSKLRLNNSAITVLTLGIGFITIIISFMLSSYSVFAVIVAAVSLLGAGIGSAVLIKLLNITHTGTSLLASIVSGLIAAYLWKMSDAGAVMNEAGIGIVAGICINYIVIRALYKINRNKKLPET